MGSRCSCCGTSTGPFHEVEGLFTALMCAGCLAAVTPTQLTCSPTTTRASRG